MVDLEADLEEVQEAAEAVVADLEEVRIRGSHYKDNNWVSSSITLCLY